MQQFFSFSGEKKNDNQKFAIQQNSISLEYNMTQIGRRSQIC